MRILVPTVITLVCASAPAQACPRPQLSGLPLQIEPTSTITYADGYATEANMQFPATAPPACGWPLVVYVHRLGASRFEEFFGLQQRIAAQGYAVWTYDVRGQGSGLLLPQNVGHSRAGAAFWGPVERFDLAEQLQFVGSQPQWQGVVDPTRIAVVGFSQGAPHAWAAAAFSGQSITVPLDPARGSIQMPAIRCVIASDYVAESMHDWLREDLLWSSWFVNQITDGLQHVALFGYQIDQQFRDAAATAFRDQTPDVLLSAWDAEGRRLETTLQQSSVAVLYSHAYHDLIDSPLLGLQALQTMTGPTKALCSTIGHNTPPNARELAHREQMFARWLHRFLWDELNEVELEPPAVLAELPLAAAERNDLGHLWSHAFVSQPLQPPASTRYYLLDDHSLQTIEPVAALPSGAIVHAITDPNFTATNYLASFANQDLAVVLAAAPLSELVYAVPPLTAEQELAGAARVHLQVTPSAARWLCALLLTVQPFQGEEVLLSSWAAARGSSVPGIAEAVEVTLPPVAARLPAGTVVRLRLRNHWLRMAPQAPVLETAPMFTPFSLQIGHGDQTVGSWLDLPLQPVRPKLVADRTELELATLPPLLLKVRGGADRAGRPYFVVASSSGQQPGVAYLNDVIPIEMDWLTGIVMAAWLIPQFTGFLSDLDGNGDATAVMDLSAFAPLPPALAGMKLTFAAFVWDGLFIGSGAASTPVDVILR